MQERPNRVELVSSDDAGARIRQRRAALGMTVKALAERAGVDRGRLAAIEDGATAREATLGAIERALSDLEQETSGPYDEGGMVTFRLSGNFGVDVVVSGPVTSMRELEQSVERLLQKMGKSEQGE